MPSRLLLRDVVALVALAAGAPLAGCATFHDAMEPIHLAFERGDYAAADAGLDRLRHDDGSNRHVYALNQGVTKLARRMARPALDLFKLGRDRMDALTTPGFDHYFAAALTDDTALPYPGEDYERILVRAMLALTDLMEDGRDADAFALQVLEQQLEIMRSFEDEEGNRPKQDYKLVAFGSYLRGIINEGNPMTLDVARREFRRVTELAPEFPYGQADLERVHRGRHSGKGNGVVHVLALVGRGPFKIEAEEPVTSAALAIAQVAWSIHRDRIVFPNLSAVKVPRLAYYRNNPTEVEVLADGRPMGRTATVTDVNRIAAEQFETMRDWIVARAVLRRVFKIVVIEGAKEATRRARHERDWSNLGIDLAGMIWTGLERADTRCWSLLPAAFQALRLELPEGDHTLTLHAGQGGRRWGRAQTVSVRVRDGFNTYVLALVPTLDGGPPPLCSDQPGEEALAVLEAPHPAAPPPPPPPPGDARRFAAARSSPPCEGEGPPCH